MQKDKIQEILDNQLEQDKLYDKNASSLIDEAAQDEKSLDIDEAYRFIDSKFSGHQGQRLLDIKQLFESTLPREFGNKIKPRQYQIGNLDAKDPMLLSDYHFEIRYSKRDVYCISKEKALLEMEAREIGKELSLSKCFVCICTVLDKVYYYFEEGELIQKITPCYNLNVRMESYMTSKRADKSALLAEIKQLIIEKYIGSRYGSYDNLLIRCSSYPGNHRILNYLTSRIEKPEIIDSQIISKCLEMAVENQCLSNIQIIFTKFSKLISLTDQDIHKMFLKIDIFSLLNNDGLNTSSPLIDILLLFHKMKYWFLGIQMEDYIELLINNKDDKQIKIGLHAERQIIVLVLVNFMTCWKSYTDAQYKSISNSLAMGFIKFSVSKNSAVSALFLVSHKFILKHIDLENIKYLRFCLSALFNSKYSINGIIQYLEQRQILPIVYDFIDVDKSYCLSKKIFLNSGQQLDISSEIVARVFSVIKLYFPTVLADIILQYLVPSVFDEMSCKIEKWNRELENERKIVSLKQLPAIQQTPGSADCGYWALFNTFKLLTELPYASQTYFNQPKIPEEIKISLSAQFEQFKALVKDNLSTPQEDLTAVDLADIFDQASMGRDQQLRKLFPDLQKKLLMWRKGSGGIPAYTIVNSALVTGESKLESAYAFGGCLPGLKLQMAINFYHLAQFKDQRQLHCILIGTAGHWHVQLLATSYFSSGSINFFQVDSATVPIQTLQLINSHLEDLLKNPEGYAQNVAEELISPIHRELMRFSGTSKGSFSFKEEEEIQKQCELLIQFFSVFGKLALAEKYLPILQMAKQITGQLSCPRLS